MNPRRRTAILALCIAALVAVVALSVVLRTLRPDDDPDAWGAGLRFPVLMIDGDQTHDVELTEYPVVSGRVAYEGPTLVEGVENWKAVHQYSGIDLEPVVERIVGLGRVETLTLMALDGWHKTLPAAVLTGQTACGRVILALSVDDEPPAEWADAPVLAFLPEDERFSNQDMLDALGPDLAHYFGAEPASTGLMVKGVTFLVVNYDGGALPSLADL